MADALELGQPRDPGADCLGKHQWVDGPVWRIARKGSHSYLTRLGIAKSIVSRRISSLESRLGTSLFSRSTRRLSGGADVLR